MPKKAISPLSRLQDEKIFIKTAIECSLLWQIKKYSVRVAAEVFLKTLVKGKRSKQFFRRFIERFLHVWKKNGKQYEKKIKQKEENKNTTKVSSYILNI